LRSLLPSCAGERRLEGRRPHHGVVGTNFWDSKVVALEEISVPAGKFWAFRVERRGHSELSNGKRLTMTGTNWIDPQTMLVIRTNLLFRMGSTITENSSSRMVAIRRGAGVVP
jgi:hypothetical protein